MRLEDICKVFTDGDWIESKDQSDEGIRLVQTGNIGEGKFLEKGDRAKYISEETFDSLKCTEIFPGDILVSRLPEPVGRACIIPEKEERMITAVDCTICRPDENMVLKEYLCYFMQSEAYYIRLMNNVTGTTRKRISRKNLGNVELDIPDKETQAVVVKNLDILSRIIDGRKEELDKLDELIKARFVELFGDPVSDTKNWGQKPLKEMLESIRYGTSTPPEFSDEGYAFIRATNIKNGRIVENDMKFIPQYEADRLEKCKLSGGEIIIVRSGVNAGDTCVVTPEYVGQYAGYDMILVLNESLNPVFLNTLINTTYMEKEVKPMTRRAAQPHLNSEQTQSFPIICVPREQQDHFAIFVEQIDKSKVVE